MKTLRLHTAGDLRLHEEAIPTCAPGEALVRIEAVGICGSDLRWFEDSGIGDARLEQPLVLGHEMAGIAESGVYQGRRVAVEPAIPCGVCEFCLEGNPHFCSSLRFAGHATQDGGLRERISWPERCLFPLPEALDALDGAMLEPLGVALHAVRLGKLRPGMRVGVLGCGPIGLLILQLAKMSGALHLAATDLLPHRLQAARELGAHTTLLADPLGGETGQLRAAVPGGLHVVFEAAGENQAVESAVAAARPGGRVVLVGIPSEDRTSFSASVARRKGLTILVCRRMKHTYPAAIALVEQGQVEVHSLVTHQFKLDEYQAAFQTASRREGLKVVLCL